MLLLPDSATLNMIAMDDRHIFLFAATILQTLHYAADITVTLSPRYAAR
jgi:hypothetical protein